MTTLVLTSLAIFIAFNATIFAAAFQYGQAQDGTGNEEDSFLADSKKLNNFLCELASNTTYVCWLTLAFLAVVIFSEQVFSVFFTGTLLILWCVFMLLIQHALNELKKYSSSLSD